MKLKVITYFLMAMMTVVTLSSCSEETSEIPEYADWQMTNEAFMAEKLAAAEADKNDDLVAYRNYSLSSNLSMTKDNSIVMKWLEKGEGTDSPIYTDSVMVHYVGYLLKSTSKQDADDPELGYVFDQSYKGTFNPALSTPARFKLAGLTDGFATALMHMHTGDRCKVYVPYNLAYGTAGSGSIPGYSTLVFDIRLVAKSHAGEALPIMR